MLEGGHAVKNVSGGRSSVILLLIKAQFNVKVQMHYQKIRLNIYQEILQNCTFLTVISIKQPLISGPARHSMFMSVEYSFIIYVDKEVLKQQ